MATVLSVEEKVRIAIKEVRAELGNSVKSITEYCKKKKIKGDISDSTDCPLAKVYFKAIKKKFPTKPVMVEVGFEEMEIKVNDHEAIDVAARSCEQNFIAKFDAEDIPELVAAESSVTT